jgi:hypothetical protein
MPDFDFDASARMIDAWRDRRIGPCVMRLLDGREFDLTGMTVNEILAFLDRAGVTPLDVLDTRHGVRGAK